MPIRLRIRQLREAMGLTQAELARRAGLRPASVNRIETGHTKGVDFDTLEALADALKVNAALLIEHERKARRRGR